MANIDLTERPQNREDLAKWYEAALVEQESSGLSVAEFADVLGLTVSVRRPVTRPVEREVGRGLPG